MKHILLFISIICGVANAQNYKDTVFTEEFSNNTQGWWEGSTADISAKVKDGNYCISHPGKSGYALWKYFYLDYSKDFEIECKIKQTNSEDQNYTFGLCWGVADWNNKHSFLVSGSSYYGLACHVNKEYKEALPFKKPGDFVNGINNYNVLKIKREGSRVIAYVNDKEIFNEKYNYPITGQNIGFEMYEKKEIQIDYIKIKGKIATLNLVPDDGKVYKKENLGANINSKFTEIMPVISADGNTLYFTRETHPGNVSVEQDIWYSKKDNAGNWSPAVNFGKPLNNKTHNFLFASSADNNNLMVGHVYNSDGTFKEVGISETQKTLNGWSMPEKVTMQDFYNDFSSNEFFISSDLNFLLTTVQRKDGYGGKDIYVSFKTDNKKYSKPINLGSVVNTKGVESSPFLSSDNKTLYFASEGHPGYGSADIFVTKRLDDTWQKWSIPLNLGPNINSSYWDAYFTIPASGNMAYLVSGQNTLGATDIFSVKVSEAAKPEPVVLIKGKVLNQKTKEPVEALIQYDDIATGKKIGEARSDPKTGDYNIILLIGRNYSFRADKSSFYPVTDNLDVSTLKEYKEINKDLYLVPIEVGQTIRLNNIFFEFDKSALKSESFEELNRLVDFLNNNKKIKIEISGHTDNKGDDNYNLKLSEKRVETVSEYLKSNGILATQFIVKGMGETKPVGSNDSEEGRALNRRVEFTILEK